MKERSTVMLRCRQSTEALRIERRGAQRCAEALRNPAAPPPRLSAALLKRLQRHLLAFRVSTRYAAKYVLR